MPEHRILARRDDGDRAALRDGIVALAGVEGTISGNCPPSAPMELFSLIA
jgi:hypothetical protein